MLRGWLNSSFYAMAFNSAEQGAVVSQAVVNEDNPEYGTEGGNSTNDKVYFLSIEETTNPAYGFCGIDSVESGSRCLKTSDYAYARGAGGDCLWWLRSPGRYTTDAATFVGWRGNVDLGGFHVYDPILAVIRKVRL